jgi:tetratricopeptide (TPR) repeat protein
MLIRVVTFSFFFTLLCGPAHSQEDVTLARGYYQLGVELYKRSDYGGALKQFKLSYAASKKADLLFNIARCYESLGETELAIRTFQQLIDAKPEEESGIRERISNLQRSQSKDRKRPKKSSLVPWLVTGGGIAVAVTGAVLTGISLSQQSSLEESNRTGDDWTDVQDKNSLGKTLNTSGIVMLAVGGAIVATGTVLLILHGRKEKRRATQAWVAPAITAKSAYVGAGFTF